jgi:hypothetical protein
MSLSWFPAPQIFELLKALRGEARLSGAMSAGSVSITRCKTSPLGSDSRTNSLTSTPEAAARSAVNARPIIEPARRQRIEARLANADGHPFCSRRGADRRRLSPGAATVLLAVDDRACCCRPRKNRAREERSRSLVQVEDMRCSIWASGAVSGCDSAAGSGDMFGSPITVPAYPC